MNASQKEINITVQKRIPLILSFLFIFQNSYSQISQFSDWIGSWESHYINNLKRKQTENLTIKWVHNKRWLQFEISGEQENSELKFSSTMVLTVDNDFNVVGYYIDENGFDGMGAIKGKIDENQLMLEGESIRWTSKSTWELKDGELVRKGKTKLKDTGESLSSETVFKKKL